MSDVINNSPVATKQFDRVHAAIWRRDEGEGRDKQQFSLTLTRNYKDSDNEWRRTHSFSPRDLPHVALAIEWATRELLLKEE